MAGKAAKRAKRPRALIEQLSSEEAAEAFERGEVLMLQVEECIRKYGWAMIESLKAGDLVAYAHEGRDGDIRGPFIRSDDLVAWIMKHPDAGRDRMLH